jgi:hypothetical protein
MLPHILAPLWLHTAAQNAPVAPHLEKPPSLTTSARSPTGRGTPAFYQGTAGPGQSQSSNVMDTLR